ncbi:MAG: YiiX/YebB-like N1pC/P60 family cysteine hydrolase [Bacteroidota bacterium]|nr:YiiX/YebB-like N1pC/P60 family cysteine hydrolase [Bacteroidota bacterium]
MRSFSLNIIAVLSFVLFFNSMVSFAQPSSLKTGDIVFVRRDLEQTSKNNYDFVGVIFFENKTPMVFYSDAIVTKCPLKDLIGKTRKNDYDFKRIVDVELITDETVASMKAYANAKLNKKFDSIPSINSNIILNGEFIWKLFQTSIGISLCKAKDIKIETFNHTFISRRTVTVKDLYESENTEQIIE